MPHANAKQLSRLLLAALALSLTACATKTPVSEAACPALPPLPSVATPMPQQTYSISAAEAIKAWRKKLMDSLATP